MITTLHQPLFLYTIINFTLAKSVGTSLSLHIVWSNSTNRWWHTGQTLKTSIGKAMGPDELPIEVFKVCPVCQQLLVELLQAIWSDEDVPTDFAKEAKIIMLYKNKGSSDDLSKYRSGTAQPRTATKHSLSACKLD